MKLRFTPRALQNLATIAEYLTEQNPRAAARVSSAILRSIENLVLFPQAGRLQKAEGVRKLVTRHYRYLIYYTADRAADEIAILAIRHPAQAREHSDS